jgi:hypothetical protein
MLHCALAQHEENGRCPCHESESVVVPNSPESSSSFAFLRFRPCIGPSGSSSDGFKSSSKSQTGLAGRFPVGADGGGGGAGGGGDGEALRSSSMSHAGLGGRGWRAAAAFFGREAVVDGESMLSTSHGGLASRTGTAFSFPLLLADSPDGTGVACEARLSNAGTVLGGCARNGRSNASFIRRTLTAPKPGSAERRSELAVAMRAKLCEASMR